MSDDGAKFVVFPQPSEAAFLLNYSDRESLVGNQELFEMPEKKVGVRKTRSATVDIPSQPVPDSDAIAARAYQLFLERGGEHGRELEDWLAAERELVLTRSVSAVTVRRATDRRRAPRSPDL
jgi:hypothetical protein